MPRIVSIRLERWPITRFLAAQARGETGDAPVDPDQPFVLAAPASGGPALTAVNAAATALGLAVGQRLADARARAGALQVRDAAPAADDAALARLALWATRYTPVTMPWGEDEGADGLFLDVTGSAHLFGGEAGLLADLGARLARFGLDARLALADTPGAGWALTRHGGRRSTVLPVGEAARSLRPLPVGALRLPWAARETLKRLGFARIGDLLGAPRAPLARRFGSDLLRRLDQAVGTLPEPLAPLAPPPAYEAFRPLLEPIGTQEAVVRVAADLMADLAPALERAGVGARRLTLILYRVDGAARALAFGLAAPTRDPAHWARLVRLRLDRLGGALDAGFGFEALRLGAEAVDPMPARQEALSEARTLLLPASCLSPRSGERARAGGLSRASERSEGEGLVVSLSWPGSSRPSRPERLKHSGRDHRDKPGDDSEGGPTLRLRLAPSANPQTAPSPRRRGEAGQAGKERRSSPVAPVKERLAPLVDSLRQRLGARSVRRVCPQASHMPERAVTRGMGDEPGPPWPDASDEDALPRPALLFALAEPAQDVLALVPDGPPERFRWRGRLHRVARAQGPERIAPEWWLTPTKAQPTRDYFLIEDERGRRLWLFREGLYGRETEHSRWFVHGVFA